MSLWFDKYVYDKAIRDGRGRADAGSDVEKNHAGDEIEEEETYINNNGKDPEFVPEPPRKA